MSVASVFVVCDDDVWTFLAHETHHFGNRPIEVGLVKTGGVVIVGSALHARVTVPELGEATDAENAHRLIQFAGTHLGQILGRRERRVADFADRAIGAGHQHGADAFGAVTGEDATGAEALVVRMRVDGHEHAGGTRQESVIHLAIG